MMLQKLVSGWREPEPQAANSSGSYTAVQRDQAKAHSPANGPYGQPEVKAIVHALRLTGADCLLQLGCGCGELSRLLFPHVGSFLGVDRSAACISDAQRAWSRPGYSFMTASVAGYAATAPTPWRFTAVLCDSGLAHLTPVDVLATLQAISIRFRRVDRVLIGVVSNVAQPGDSMTALAEATGWRIAHPHGTPDGGSRVEQPGMLLLRDVSVAAKRTGIARPREVAVFATQPIG